MTNTIARNKVLCSNFCAYYKPGKNEGLSCRAHDVVQQLIRRGKLTDLAGPCGKFDCAKAESLVEWICVTCGFQDNDCDFMLDRKAPPCGGFVLLARLLEEGAVTPEDIRSAAGYLADLHRAS